MKLCQCCRAKEVKKGNQVCHLCKKHRLRLYAENRKLQYRIGTLEKQIANLNRQLEGCKELRQKYSELEPYLIIAEKMRNILLENEPTNNRQ